MTNNKIKPKAKRLKETESRLKKIESKLKLRLNSTIVAMAKAKQISASLDRLEGKK
jgi:hypothetical protein